MSFWVVVFCCIFHLEEAKTNPQVLGPQTGQFFVEPSGPIQIGLVND